MNYPPLQSNREAASLNTPPTIRRVAVEAAMENLTIEANSMLNLHSELWKRLQKVSRQEPANGAGDNGQCPSTGCQLADDITRISEMIQSMRVGLEYQLKVLEV